MKTYESLAANIGAVEKLGYWIAHSKMFGCTSVEQGYIIAADCFITGVPLLEYQKRNHLISGRPDTPYDAMLAAFQEAGGHYKVIEKSPEAARVEMTYDGQTVPFSLTWADAQKEAFVYNGKEPDILAALQAGKTPPLKPKYATPRSRAVMLFARVVSDALRTIAPRTNFGTYTPEEIEDIPEVDGGAAATPVIEATSRPAITHQAAPAESVPTQAAASGTESATPEAQSTVSDKPADTRTSVELSEPMTESHRKTILDLMGRLKQDGVADIAQRVKAKLAEAGLSGLADLSIAEAETLIRALQTKELEVWATAALTGHVKAKETSQGNA